MNYTERIINYLSKSDFKCIRYFGLAWKGWVQKNKTYASRKEYFWALPGFSLIALTYLCIWQLSHNKIIPEFIHFIASFLVVMPTLVLLNLTAKRLNDNGKNKTQLIILLIPAMFFMSMSIFPSIIFKVVSPFILIYITYQLCLPTDNLLAEGIESSDNDLSKSISAYKLEMSNSPDSSDDD